MTLAAQLFDALREASLDPPGVSRASYGAGERAAHAIIRAAAEQLGLQCRVDPVGTLFMTLPGADRSLSPVMIGSHLDAVTHGGNFDGAAGVVMGLALVAQLQAERRVLPRDLTILGIRAEEMCWFPVNYIGSRAAFGLLPPGVPDSARRSDSGKTLAEHMLEEGFDPDFIRQGKSSLDPARIHAFIEPHIEQGPVLVGAGLPCAIVTGIRGILRHPICRAHGAWNHAGAVPRGFRQDAVLATAQLAARLDALWDRTEASGGDLVLTMGEFWTPAAMHAPTKVPGEVAFSLDIRSEQDAVLDAVVSVMRDMAEEALTQRRVTLDYGEGMRAAPALMHPRLRAALRAGAAQAGVPCMEMTSGAGHDCASFVLKGVPSAMLFIRNANGSHNPDEAMALEDFGAALRVLVGAIEAIAAN
ncbi:hydantoinase/carbamoylase family amidase [Sediminicoccus sp. KRV36]|uniref:hydantoinase/carbamoylase family amidase n=1 Tax=Sediminicoccus sp. KRV36 TaxID=3133721 RepID=UPI00200F9FA5|nr:hydantoinase/carbamoylase family amidase [Sediminicoccus rosea]UPY35735.1 hydantoinase/carbamoylase family amidase [Sediminicoccus rosea]